MVSHSYPKIIVEGPVQACNETVRVSFPELMVHGQFIGICLHSSLMSSQLGRRFSDFCGIYNLFKFNMNVEIEIGITVLRLNFEKFDCE